MIGIARHALKSPFHAFTVVGLLAVLSLIIPFVSLFSGAIVSLLILTQGFKSGVRVVALTVLGLSVMTWISAGSPLVGLMIGIVQWLPMIVLAEVLRRTQSFSLVIIVSMALGSIAVLLQFYLWPDLDQFWRSMIAEMFNQSKQGDQYAVMQPAIELIVHWMVLLFVAAMMSTYVSTLMIGRWFQAKLVESEGYKKEFYEIKLGKSSALISLLIIIVSSLAGLDWLIALAIVLASGFLFQGLAVVHSRINQTAKKGLFYGLFYFLLIVFPQAVALTAGVGIIDNWLNLRKSDKSLSTH